MADQPADTTHTNPAMPTAGALLGTIASGVIAAKTGIAADPVLATTITGAVTSLFTALFHWIGTKTHTPGL